jgi:hypothetical protein
MRVRKAIPARSFLAVHWGTWLAIGIAMAWCWSFYLMRQPQKPYAFDLPQAQAGFSPSSPWSASYPSTIFNCGRAGTYLPSCANYCDPTSRIRYVACTSS